MNRRLARSKVAPAKMCTYITLRSASGSKRKFPITGSVIPEIGDVVTLNGQDHTVVARKEEKVIAEFSTAGGKLTQVFPLRASKPKPQRRAG